MKSTVGNSMELLYLIRNLNYNKNISTYNIIIFNVMGDKCNFTIMSSFLYFNVRKEMDILCSLVILYLEG